MGEIVETGAADTSTPATSVDIAAQVIETAENESGDTGETAGYEAPDRIDAEQAEPLVAKPEPMTPAEISAAAKFLEKQGHQAKKQDGRDVWLPFKTVEKMLDRYAEEQRGPWTGERTTLEGQLRNYEAERQEMYADIKGDPRAFISKLAQYDPRYKALLGEPQPAAQRAPSGEMPAPDYDLGNGQRTYTPEGLQKLIEWAVDARMMPKVDERLKPWEESKKADEEARRADEEMRELRTRTDTQMQEAQTWAMFGAIAPDGKLTPFQQEVLGEMQKESEACRALGLRPDGKPVKRPTMTVRQAYLEVYARHQEPDKVRARVLEEIKGAKPAPALSRQSADSPRQTKPVTTQDIVRKVIAQAESQA
jgi:hypothetical protein